MRTIYYSLFILFIGFISIFSQNNSYLNITSDNFINKMAEEGDYLWLATSGGLVRFNKVTEEVIRYNPFNSGVKDYDFSAIVVDEYGNKIIGSDNLYIFDGTNWKVFDAENNTKYFSQFDIITAVARHKNKILFSTTNRMIKTDGENLSYPDSTEYPGWYGDFHEAYFIKWDKNDRLWIGGMFGAGYYDGSAWQFLDVFNNPFYTASSILFGDGNKVYVGTNYGLAIGDSTKWQSYSKNDSNAPFYQVYDIAMDSSRNIWLATDTGLVKYDGTSFRIYNSENSGLISNLVNSIIVDKNGVLWLGTNLGLVKYDGKFRYFDINLTNFASNSIPQIFYTDKYGVWYCTDQGIVNYKDGKWYYEEYPNKSEYMYRCSEMDEQGNIWIGTLKDGLLKFDGNRWRKFDTVYSAISGNQIVAMSKGKPGDLWVSIYGKGIMKYDGTNWQSYNSSNSNLTITHIEDMQVDRNNKLWFAFKDTIYSYANDKMLKYPNINSLLKLNFWSSKMKLDNNDVLWISGEMGIIKFDEIDNKVYNYPDSANLDNRITSFYFDKNNEMWAGSLSKIYHLNSSNELNIQKFDISPKRDLRIRSFIRDSSGNFWIGSYGLLITRDQGIILSTNESQQDVNHSGLNLSPNPATDYIEINVPVGVLLAVPREIEIYDIMGERIQTTPSTTLPPLQTEGELKIDVSGFVPGVYFVKIGDRVQRFVKL